MNKAHEVQTSANPTRVGVVLADLGKLNVKALKYLVLHLNMLQHCCPVN